MSLAQTFVAEFDQEMAITRRLLQRVPSDKAKWKPHEKSFAMGHLAQLVARMPGWNTLAMRDTALDLSGAPAYSYETTDTLLAEFDRHVEEARAALVAAKDQDFGVPWTLKQGDRVFFTMPRGAVVRQNISHLIHHRGQLSVYLRLVDVPLPVIYGPTADEKW
jgi:uncharacterized damage-inducible protein DinB